MPQLANRPLPTAKTSRLRIYQTAEPAVSVSSIIDFFKRNFVTIIASVAISLLGVAAYVMLTQPIYRASAHLLIDANVPQVFREHLGETRAVLDSAQLESQAATSLARAYQEGAKTEVAVLELRSNRLTQITDELRKAQAKLDELGHRLRTSLNLLHETEVIAPHLSTRAQWKTNSPVLTVVRARAGRANELTVSETTRLEPGDALKVEIPVPETQQPELARTVRGGPSAGSFGVADAQRG